MEHNTEILRRGSAWRRGFTLIELLVVVAIISLLVAIILPALGRAKESTRRAVCQCNLKQIHMAWSMYFQDHNGSLYRGLNANRDYGGWRGFVFPHYRRPLNKHLGLSDIPSSESEAEVFHCPSDKGGLPGSALDVYTEVGTSYQTNVLIVGQDHIGLTGEFGDAVNRCMKTLNYDIIENPSSVLLIGDYPWVFDWLAADFGNTTWHGKDHWYSLAFVDGHVEFLPIEDGLYLTPEYTVLPTTALYGLASASGY